MKLVILLHIDTLQTCIGKSIVISLKSNLDFKQKYKQ